MAVAVLIVIAGAMIEMWFRDDQAPTQLSGRVLVAADTKVDEGALCMVVSDGYRLDAGSNVTLYPKDADGELVFPGTSTKLNEGKYVRAAGSMACALTFDLPRSDRTAISYRLTATARTSDGGVRTHYWDLSAGEIFDVDLIEVDLQ